MTQDERVREPQAPNEISWPLSSMDPELTTAVRLLEARAAKAPDHVAFRNFAPDGSLTPVTTAEFVRAAKNAAALLIAQGIQRGDRILVIGETSYDWALADLASWYAGAVVVPVYPGSVPHQIAAAQRATGATLALVDTLPDQEGWPSPEAPLTTLPMSALAAAPQADDRALVEVHERWQAVGPDDVASLVFTSGTSGEPRPVQVLHSNLTGLVQTASAEYGSFLNERGSTLIMLPLAHILARAVQLVCLYTGMTVTHLSDLSQAMPAMKKVRPTFLMVVPRVLEKVMERLAGTADKVKLGRGYRAAQRQAIAEAKRQQDPTAPPLKGAAKLRHAALDKLVFSRLRSLFGGRIDYLLSGASALPADVGLFFQGAGMPVIQGYGLTETTAPIAGQRPDRLRAGTVGQAFPGATIRIAEDGEVLVKGPGVCVNYGGDPEDPQSALDEDGFLSTGDLGVIEDGHLVIAGRKKDIITTAYGKSVSPLRWEEEMRAVPGVERAVMVGENRPFLVGVVLMDAAEGAEPLSTWSGSTDDLDGRNAELSAQVARPERVRSLLVLNGGIDDDRDLVTQTGKLRRSRFEDRLQELVDGEYRRLEQRHLRH